MPSNGKRVAYGRNQNRVSLSTYPDDTSVPVRTSHWNQDPHDQAILGFTKITATLDASGVIYTKDDSATYAEDDGSTYSRQSTLIEVECEGSTTTDAIVKIDVTDTNENDILYLFKGTASDTITIADATPSVAGHIKTQLSGGATLAHDGVPIMLIRRGDYWYEFGADGATSTFTATSTDTLENKTINTSDNTITVASADVTGLSSSLALKAPIASPTFTGTVAIPNIANLETTVTSKAPIASPTFTGTVAIPNYADVETTLDGIATKAPLANPTFTGTVTTAAVDVAGNNIDNIQNLIHDISTTTTALDFSGDQLQTISISAPTTFTTSNLAVGKSKTIKITTDGTLRTLTFPAWKFVGTKPTDQAASKVGILTLTSFGTTDADCVAAYAVEE